MGLLLNALNHLLSIRYLLGTHLPQSLVKAVEQDPRPGAIQARRMQGSLLFADVSGFTALSEHLASKGQQGIEQLTQLLNDHFESMVEILIHSGGELLKYAGDALLAYFPTLEGGQQAQWAVRAGHRMLRAMAAQPADDVVLRMKVGIATGPFYAASVGTARRMEYVILGDAVNRTLAAEKAAVAGQVVVDTPTTTFLPNIQCAADLTPGFHETRVIEENLGDFEIRSGGRRRPRSSASWMSGRDEVISQILKTLQQVETLASYLPTVLAQRIIATIDTRHLPGENRPVAVLFIHAHGFDADSDSHENTGKLIAQTLSDYFRTVQQVVSRYEGVISRVDPYADGSKFLILFGAPVAHEDDPHRAVRAALEIDAGLAHLYRSWQRLSHPPEVQHRFGITYGPTFAGQVGTSTHREYTVMGDDVNLAARLMGSAKPRQILVSETVRSAVGAHIHFKALPRIQVRGKEALISVWQVEALRDDRLVNRLQSRGPLIGREADWERAVAILNGVLAGEGARLIFRGEAGIGKSHLADTLAKLALKRGARVFPTASTAYLTGTPYTPWATLLKTMASIENGDAQHVRSNKLEEMLRSLGRSSDAPLFFNLLGLQRRDDALSPVRTRTTAPAETPGRRAGPNLFNQLGRAASRATEQGPNLWDLARQRRAEPQQASWQRLQDRVTSRERERLFEAIMGFLKTLADQGPLVLIFEDAQWMDQASRDLLEVAVNRLADAPLLLLVVERSLERKGRNVLFLDPLTAEGTRALVERLLHDVPTPCPPEELSEALHRLTHGNPLFIEEVIRWLQRTEWSQLDRLDTALRSSSMLQELVISRLDTLPYDVGEVARAAAVAGNAITRGEIESILDLSQSALSKALQQLEEEGWLLPANQGYLFRQPLVREMIYDSLPRARRRKTHAQLAAHLETRTQQAGDRVEMLAHHYARAGDHESATTHLLTAGLEAEERGAYERAHAYYEQALKQARAGEASAKAYESQGDAALLMGDLTSAETAYRAARKENAAKTRLLIKQVVVHYSQAQVHYREGNIEAAQNLLDEAWMLLNEGKMETAVTAGVQQAIDRVKQNSEEPWPILGWQRCEGTFHVALLLPES